MESIKISSMIRDQYFLANVQICELKFPICSACQKEILWKLFPPQELSSHIKVLAQKFMINTTLN